MIIVNNDGKNRHQSFTAELVLSSDSIPNPMIYFDFYAYGYGRTEEESLSNLVLALGQTIRSIEQAAMEKAMALNTTNFGLDQSELDAY